MTLESPRRHRARDGSRTAPPCVRGRPAQEIRSERMPRETANETYSPRSRSCWLARACGGSSTPSAADPRLRDPHPHPHWIRRAKRRTARRAAADAPSARRHGGRDRGTTYEFQVADNRLSPSTSNIADSLRCRRQASRKGLTANRVHPRQDCSRQRCSTGARAVQGIVVRPMVGTRGTFRSKLMGFLRAGELFDPLTRREEPWTNSVRITTFIKARVVRLNLPVRATSGTCCRRPSATASPRWMSKASRQRTRQTRKVFRIQEEQDGLRHQPLPGGYPVSRHDRFTAKRPSSRAHPLQLGGRPEAPLRARHREAECVRTAAEPGFGLSLEGDLGQRLPPRCARRRRQWGDDLRLRSADTPGHVRAKSALRLPRGADRPQRRRVRIDRRHDLPQRVAEHSTASGVAGHSAEVGKLT